MKKIIQRLLAAAASAAMLSSLALPSFAADPGKRFGTQLDPEPDGKNKITLTEHEGVKPTGDPHFGAYQIFTGTMSGPNQHPTNPGDIEKTDPAAGTEALQGIEFGNAFGTLDSGGDPEGYAKTVTNIESFVIALANASNGTGDYAEYQYAFSDFKGFENFVDGGTGKLITEYYNEDGSTLNVSVLAKAVAEVVAAHNNREWLEEFCDIALGFGHTDPQADAFDVPGFVNQYYPFTSSTDDAGTTTWSVTLNQSGYYMVVDMSNLTEGDEDRAFSARMLLVAGAVTQDLKESVPEIEKQVEDGETWGENATAGVGETVNFQITGTLPSNYDLFAGGYYYAFHDTLTNGLKLSQDPITIEVEGLWEDTGTGTGAADPDTWVWNAKAKQTITEGSVAPAEQDADHTQHITDGNAYTIETKDNGFDIVFPCLKEIYITDGDTHYMLGCGNGGKEVSKITVSYSATVTEDAIIKTGNVNTATLEYSDNPQAYDDHDTTHEDTATVYTLGLDVTKVDGTKFVANGGSDGSTLAGIKFALLRGDSEKGYEIATFKQVDASTAPDDPAAGGFAGEKYYSITAWTSLTLDSEKDLAKSAQAFIADNAEAEITTDEQGKLLISGLNDEVAYTLVEVETLPGYKLAKPFQFSYKVPESANELALEEDANCAVSGDDAMSYDKFIKDTTLEGTIEGDNGDGAGDLLMANFNVADLPATGGMGNSIYYIIGCGALVLAGVMFVLSRKKSARAAS